jgi:hypothetical protein
MTSNSTPYTPDGNDCRIILSACRTQSMSSLAKIPRPFDDFQSVPEGTVAFVLKYFSLFLFELQSINVDSQKLFIIGAATCELPRPSENHYIHINFQCRKMTMSDIIEVK